MKNEEIRFGSFNEVIKVDNLECFEQDKRVHNIGFGLWLERSKAQQEQCSNKAREDNMQKLP